MSKHTTPNARTVRVRSCRKRSFIKDDESSPEIESSTSKKPKTVAKLPMRTPRTLAKKSTRQSNATNGVTTRPSPAENAADGTPKRRGRLRKGVAQKREHADDVIVVKDSPQAADVKQENGKSTQIENELPLPQADDCTFEQRDTWPMKFSPSSFGIFVGNKVAVEKVERWLIEWKLASKKSGHKDYESSSSSNHQQEVSSSALFITGPPGVGKTSLVYFLAKRLGFTVLEVNSSSERPGKRVLADLQEATQSQHVEGTKLPSGGISAFFKPTLTQTSSSALIQAPALTAATKGRKKSKIVTVKDHRGTLKNFFSPVAAATSRTPAPEEVPTSTAADDLEATEQEKPRKSSIKSFFAPKKKTTTLQSCEVSRCASESPEIVTEVRQSSAAAAAKATDGKIKCSSSTIILFDDVDVIFDDNGDEGFWMALETVLKSSKKPCILTATRGHESVLKRCRSLQNAPLVELHRPSPSHVASLISDICAAEGRDLTDYNVEFMSQYLASDVRRSLVQMEFETVSSGLLQTVHPANKTMGGLMTAGSTEDALEIQIAFKKVGFNALYASLEDCLPFEFEDVLLKTAGRTSRPDENVAPKRSSSFEAATIKDLSQIFDEFSTNDLFAGCLGRMGEECLPSYERAKRWMKQHPLESHDSSQRAVEELLELSSTVLLGNTSVSFGRISERFAALNSREQSEYRLCRVANFFGFEDIHKQLKKIRVSETCLNDVLHQFAIRHRVAFDYLDYLTSICRFENDKRDKGRRGNRFTHYLSNIGVFLSSEQLSRLSNFWS